MKRVSSLLLLSMFVAIICSCEQREFEPAEWAISPELELSESGIIVTSSSEQYSISVITNYKGFTASSNQTWCKVKVDLNNSKVDISIDPNDGASQRHAVVTVSVQRGKKSLTKDFSIYQMGGVWDVVENTDIRMRWSNAISESQKNIIKKQIQQFVFVEGGTFVMGAQKEERDAPYYDSYASEDNPPHRVTLSDYYMGKFEVTQEQWAAVMTTSPSKFIAGNKPVENISWFDAMEYIAKLSNLTGLDLRMPTSAQWEYAARGGRLSMGFRYAGSDNIDDVAHYIPTSTPETSPLYSTIEVGQKKPNELGIYDMTGNVSEICSDWAGVVPEVDQIEPVEARW